MAEIGGAIPSFDGLLDNDCPKDTEVVIIEEGKPTSTAQGSAAGTEEEQGSTDSSITLAAHWVVLWSLSPYFRAKLERWSSTRDVVMAPTISSDPNNQQQQPSYQYSLQLLVPPGRLELGRRLITAMYSSSPDLSDLEAPQLMQLVALAECYGVGKVVTTAAAQLEQLSVATMPLATAAAVFELPEACLGLKAFAEDRAAWKLPARPASSVKEVVVQWQLPLPKLEEVVQGKGSIDVRPEESLVTWCGRSWGINVRVYPSHLGMYLLSKREAARYSARFCVQGIPAQQSSVLHSVQSYHFDRHILGNGDTWGCVNVLDWGAGKNWPQVKEWLELKKLVQPDGCLHLRITVSQVS